jgi:hypothetical protein
VIKKSDLKCNQPKRTPGHPKKSHVVKACEGGKERTFIRNVLGLKQVVVSE